MYINLAAPITRDSVVDGPGIRSVIWTQGCLHKCPGCHNPQTHSMSTGKQVEIEKITKQLLNIGKNVTFSGGDPFYQPLACLAIAQQLKLHNLNVWAYSGFTYEEIIKDSDKLAFLSFCDRLVDGPFINERKSMTLPFRGSDNQRIIMCQESLILEKVVLDDSFNELKTENTTLFI